MKSLFEQNLDEHRVLFDALYSLDSSVESASRIVASTMQAGGKLMVCGNGGSAADSQHIAAEFTGRFIADRKPLAAMALSTDTSALTCISNDYSFDEVFSRQVMGLGRQGDCLIAISTSGNSANVIKAVQVARDIGVVAIGLLGRDGGKLVSLCDESIIVPHQVTARIQEAHILIAHTICGRTEQLLNL